MVTSSHHQMHSASGSWPQPTATTREAGQVCWRSLGYFAHSNTDSKEQVKSSLWSLYSPGLSWKQQEAILKSCIHRQ